MNLLRSGHPDTDALLPLSDIQLPRIMGPTEAFANCHVILHTGWSTASAFYFTITIVGDMVRLNVNFIFCQHLFAKISFSFLFPIIVYFSITSHDAMCFPSHHHYYLIFLFPSSSILGLLSDIQLPGIIGSEGTFSSPHEATTKLNVNVYEIDIRKDFC